MRNILTALAVTLGLVSTLSISTTAQTCATAGCLDETFGISGRVTTNINFRSARGWATALVIQPSDGKIVVTGHIPNYPLGTGRDFYVLRYEPTGVLDQTFGVGGISQFSMTSAIDDEYPNTITLQGDGKIVVGGSVTGKFAIARLDANGAPDNTFGTGGKVLFNFASNQSAALNDITIQANGYIVAVGSSHTNNFAVARLTPAGALDTMFNATGKVRVSTASGNDFGGANAVVIQSDGKIIAVGRRPLHKNISRDFAVLRFNANGTLDSSFGSGGKVFTDFNGSGDAANDVAIDAADKIVVAGSIGSSGGTRYGIARYNTNGTLDTSFGTGGKMFGGTGYQVNCEAVVIQSDGKIAIAGSRQATSALSSNDFLVARFNSNGSPDTSFGTGGITLTDFDVHDSDQALALAVQPDGKLAAAGLGNYAWDIALARYLP